MVNYCCVKGCRNNTNTTKKKSRRAITFHPFPSSPHVRAKWLSALDRELWQPAPTAGVCSKHFRADAIRWDGGHASITEDAVPTLQLPTKSTPEVTEDGSVLGTQHSPDKMSSKLEVCRVCLATELRMVSLQRLQTCVDVIAPYCNNFTMEGLPQVVCYLCAAQLLKCYKFLTMCQTSQDTLADVLSCHGTITKSLIENEYKTEQLSPISRLQIHRVTAMFNYRYDDEEQSSRPVFHDNVLKEEIQGPLEEIDNVHMPDLVQKDFKTELDFDYDEEKTLPMEVRSAGSDFDSEDEKALVPSLKKLLDDQNREWLFVMKEKRDGTKQRSKSRRKSEKKIEDGVKCKLKRKEDRCPGQRKGADELSPNELLLEEHFNIIKLTLEEQIAEWRSINVRRSHGKKYPCEVCCKGYMHQAAYQTHLAGHDPSRGPASCPVCKLRYKSDVLVRSHVKFSHSKKYHCKTCAKTFNTLCMAVRHHKMHSGTMYRCSQCSFSTQHEALLSQHLRRRHPVRQACARCGLGFASAAGLRLHVAKAHADHAVTSEAELSEQFKCVECELSFTSEDARRVHYLTSFQHKKQRNMLEPNARRSCKWCGLQFASQAELATHGRTAHAGGATAPRPAHTSAGPYPIDCEHCEARLNSRKEHWAHVRQYHPKQRASYRPVITAVCETCGKGFQNTTKLQLHELRHASPTVRCEFCGKLFYDKFRLNDHLATHSETFPHRCTICGRGFKAQPNLSRHYKTHTDIATYECTLCGKKFKYSTSLNLHVRSVHYKIPPPPRKKRSRTKHSAAAADIGVRVNANDSCNLRT